MSPSRAFSYPIDVPFGQKIRIITVSPLVSRSLAGCIKLTRNPFHLVNMSDDSLTAQLVSAASTAPRGRWGQSSQLASSSGVDLANRFARTANTYSSNFSSKPTYRVGKFARGLRSSRSTIDPDYASLRRMLGREYSQMISVGAAPQVMTELASAGRWRTLDRLQGHLSSLVDRSDGSDPPPPYESVVRSSGVASSASVGASSESPWTDLSIDRSTTPSSTPSPTHSWATISPSPSFSRIMPTSDQSLPIPDGLIYTTRTFSSVSTSAHTAHTGPSNLSSSIPDGLIHTTRNLGSASNIFSLSSRGYDVQSSRSASNSIFQLPAATSTTGTTPIVEPSELYGSSMPEGFELPGSTPRWTHNGDLGLSGSPKRQSRPWRQAWRSTTFTDSSRPDSRGRLSKQSRRLPLRWVWKR